MLGSKATNLEIKEVKIRKIGSETRCEWQARNTCEIQFSKLYRMYMLYAEMQILWRWKNYQKFNNAILNSLFVILPGKRIRTK